jgi:hypothetical protein
MPAILLVNISMLSMGWTVPTTVKSFGYAGLLRCPFCTTRANLWTQFLVGLAFGAVTNSQGSETLRHPQRQSAFMDVEGRGKK